VKKYSATNPLFKEIVESQIAFARRATQWEQDTVVGRKMAPDYYFSREGPRRRPDDALNWQSTVRDRLDGALSFHPFPE
jgi:hypothetical protein